MSVRFHFRIHSSMSYCNNRPNGTIGSSSLAVRRCDRHELEGYVRLLAALQPPPIVKDDLAFKDEAIGEAIDWATQQVQLANTQVAWTVYPFRSRPNGPDWDEDQEAPMYMHPRFDDDGPPTIAFANRDSQNSYQAAAYVYVYQVEQLD